MSTDILFDNIVITHDEEVAKYWADNTFEVRRVRIAEESVSDFFLLIKLVINLIFIQLKFIKN